ncbi:MAG: alpha/beta fold hydrolase [Actinomycetales bacterium]
MSPAYLLVPGAGGVAAYWRLVAADLERRGLDAVAVDLPGDDDSAGLPEYVELIVRAGSDLGDIVVVGQSMGAFSASLAAPQLPAQRIVLVNPMIPAPGETPGEWWEATGQPEAKRRKDLREGRDPHAPFDLATYFLHDTPADLVEEVMATSRPESDAAFGSPWTLPAWPGVPTTVIAAAEDRFFPLDFQRRVSEERLGLAPVTLPGGHLVALSHPQELVDLLVAS